MKRHRIPLLIIALIFFAPSFSSIAAPAALPVIRAVLFFSPSCAHCHEVMENVLPPLVEKYPGKLDIVGIDVSQPLGSQLYQNAIAAYNVPDSRLGVPTMIVGSTVLVGTNEIQETFPKLIQTGLSGAGYDWPSFPGLDQVLASQQTPVSQLSQTEIGQQTPPGNGGPGFLNRFNQDPIANSMAVIVLIGMLVAAAAVIISYLQGAERKFIVAPEWLLPVLALIGLGVAVYLTYVEISKAYAICGPVGNCNSVQESQYAILFGVLPVGVLGAIGYLSILVAWLLKIYGPRNMQNFLAVAIWGMAWFGVLFSIYLTFLEPFVIGATCVWCISSAILITLILLISTTPAKEALRIDYEEEDEDELTSESSLAR
jgi:uncharacterized membrane protein/thiol-disulfide isomerase/thioredoxin